MFKHSPNRKSMVYDTNGIYLQWKMHYGPKRHGFMRDDDIRNDKKFNNIKDTMSL